MQDKQHIKELIDKYKQERKDRRKRLLKSFITLVTSNKLYILSLIITILFIGSRFLTKLENEVSNVKLATTASDNVPDTTNTRLDEKLDISPYVGIYSRDIKFNKELVINTCQIDSYKLIYVINSNKKIEKYFQSNCVGTILIYEDNLTYVSNGGARYIGFDKESFIFGTQSLKELDGETYKIDESIKKVNVSKIDKGINIIFNDYDIILETKDNLIQIIESTINFNLLEEYPSSGGSLDQRLYKSINNTDTYKYIVFSNNEKTSCYVDSDEEVVNYTIYQIKYDNEEKTFNSIKQVLTRYKKDGCSVYDEDLKLLKE